MRTSEIQKIIVKFLNKEANIDDLEKLDKWLDKKENTFLFNRFVQVEFLTVLGMGEYDVNKAKKQIKLKLNKVKRRNRLTLLKRMSIAASITLIIGFSLYKFYNHSIIKNEISEVEKKINVGSSKAILTLENGNQIRLNKEKKYKNEKVSSNGEELLYTNTKNANPNEEIAYNYLTIPRGGEYVVVLADDTKVWLNSDSKLKYPTKFLNGKTRTVELVYGEAYFEVSPSSNHNGDDFDVYSRNQKVNVLGTEFNIKAYLEDTEIKTTLVGGKIMIEKGITKKILKPNQQSIIKDDSDLINISEVDVSQEISWIKGVYTFNEEPLEGMMKTLARWYDAKIIFEKKALKEFNFTGILERTESIEEILKLIEVASEGEIKFEINKNEIIIK